MGKHRKPHNHGSDPWSTLALAMLRRAKNDARLGDLGALAWLVVDGGDVAETLQPGAGQQMVLTFCERELRRFDKEQVKTRWRLT